MMESPGLPLWQFEFCLEIILRSRADHLRQRFEHHNRLVSARHHCFGDGDEFILLAVYPQPRWLWFTTIELRRRSGRRLDAARLKLRDHDIELRTMAYALFDHRQNINPRKIG